MPDIDPKFLGSVAVIMAVRNGAEFLKSSIESVLQSKKYIKEIIIVDGASTDNTIQIAQQFAEVTIRPQLDQGIAAAYNQGIAEATADLIAFNSYDDLWSDNKLEIQLRLLQEQPEVQFVVGRAEQFLDANTSHAANAAALPGFRTELMRPHVAFIMETLLARKTAFDIVGRFDTNLKTAEDVDWFARARDLNVPSAVAEQTIVRKRIHGLNSHYAQDNNHFLMMALQKSIVRKRAKSSN